MGAYPKLKLSSLAFRDSDFFRFQSGTEKALLCQPSLRAFVESSRKKGAGLVLQHRYA